MAFNGVNAALVGSQRVYTGNAPQYASQRDLDSQQLVCPPPTHSDNAGRAQLPYSGFSTRTAGCYSAWDQVSNESGLRPHLTELPNLNMGAVHNNGKAENFEPENFDVMQIGGVAGFGQQLAGKVRASNNEIQRAQQAYAMAQNAMKARISSGNY